MGNINGRKNIYISKMKAPSHTSHSVNDILPLKSISVDLPSNQMGDSVPKLGFCGLQLKVSGHEMLTVYYNLVC